MLRNISTTNIFNIRIRTPSHPLTFNNFSHCFRRFPCIRIRPTMPLHYPNIPLHDVPPQSRYRALFCHVFKHSIAKTQSETTYWLRWIFQCESCSIGIHWFVCMSVRVWRYWSRRKAWLRSGPGPCGPYETGEPRRLIVCCVRRPVLVIYYFQCGLQSSKM